MSANAKTKPKPRLDAPYGTEPRRSPVPLVILAILYALWFSFLLWMALFKSGGR